MSPYCPSIQYLHIGAIDIGFLSTNGDNAVIELECKYMINMQQLVGMN